MTSHRRRKPFRPGRILLSLGAALGVVCLVAATASVFLDIRPMVVSSGSMSPAIPAGSLAFAQDTAAGNVEVGDVVAVSRADGTRVMHRVVAAEPSGGQVALTLQGDANAAPDDEIYVVDRVLAVRFDVPWLGYPVSWLSTTWGLMILGASAFGLLVFALRPSREPSAGRRRVAAFLAVPVAAVMVSTTAAPSSASFTDTGTVTSSTIATYTVPPTTLTCGAVGLLSVTFNWTAVPNATNYTLHYGTGGSSTVTTTSTTRTLTAAIAGGTAWVVVNRAVGSTTWSSVNSNTRSYTVAVVSLCS